MRGFYIGLPEIMVAPFTSLGWSFLSCIYSESVDIAIFTDLGFSAKACIYYRLFQ
ncbi:hypothetical protein [Pseudobacteroides cellulosolvens]|uniref:hypothetical protein n=1 Tax=Pseudobacteroides cellulosolvens TaxID=35825 RepID=UPI001364A455|nr:hypothetical protein [Pseudobacteroides cellulosolvens]